MKKEGERDIEREREASVWNDAFCIPYLLFPMATTNRGSEDSHWITKERSRTRRIQPVLHIHCTAQHSSCSVQANRKHFLCSEPCWVRLTLNTNIVGVEASLSSAHHLMKMERHSRQATAQAPRQIWAVVSDYHSERSSEDGKRRERKRQTAERVLPTRSTQIILGKQTPCNLCREMRTTKLRPP